MRKDDNVLPSASEIPSMLSAMRHPRKRRVSVGPQSRSRCPRVHCEQRGSAAETISQQPKTTPTSKGRRCNYKQEKKTRLRHFQKTAQSTTPALEVCCRLRVATRICSLHLQAMVVLRAIAVEKRMTGRTKQCSRRLRSLERIMMWRSLPNLSSTLVSLLHIRMHYYISNADFQVLRGSQRKAIRSCLLVSVLYNVA